MGSKTNVTMTLKERHGMTKYKEEAKNKRNEKTLKKKRKKEGNQERKSLPLMMPYLSFRKLKIEWRGIEIQAPPISHLECDVS